MFNVLDLQKQLVAAAGPSGFEHNIGALLAQLAKPFLDEIYSDPLGNVICHKKGSGKKIMLAAHMDAIGFIVTSIDEQGYIWFDRLGWHSPALLVNKRVRFANGTMGIIRPREGSRHMAKAINAVTMQDLYIDIGAKDKKQALKHLSVGDTAVFEGEPREIAGGNIIGPYADDLIGCTVLLMAMEQMSENDNDVYFVFATQEEVGLLGSHAAAQGILPWLGIACDVCGTGDTPGNTRTPMEVSLGKGPTVKIKDASVISSPLANKLVKAAAKAAGVAVQDEILTGGGTDTASIQMSGSGAHATCISIPTRYIHSPVEIINKNDAEGAAKIMAQLLSQKL